jgi:precorrin-6B methylase 2
MAPGSTFCDIGSGVGGICLEIAAAQSHLKLTLQDQPHILDKARDVSCLKYLYFFGFP